MDLAGRRRPAVHIGLHSNSRSFIYISQEEGVTASMTHHLHTRSSIMFMDVQTFCVAVGGGGGTRRERMSRRALTRYRLRWSHRSRPGGSGRKEATGSVWEVMCNLLLHWRNLLGSRIAEISPHPSCQPPVESIS